MKYVLCVLLIAGTLSTSASANIASLCNDAGDTCIVHKVPNFGTFENPIQDNYPVGEYPPGYLHAGMYCAAGNWHHGWLMPWERAPVIKPSCGRE
jgi:hypothetical protein